MAIANPYIRITVLCLMQIIQVIINALPLQQWQHKRVSQLRYTYITFPVIYKNRAVSVSEILITQSTIEMVLTLLRSWSDFTESVLWPARKSECIDGH